MYQCPLQETILCVNGAPLKMEWTCKRSAMLMVRLAMPQAYKRNAHRGIRNNLAKAQTRLLLQLLLTRVLMLLMYQCLVREAISRGKGASQTTQWTFERSAVRTMQALTRALMLDMKHCPVQGAIPQRRGASQNQGLVRVAIPRARGASQMTRWTFERRAVLTM
jgi:hypothetical protein